MRNRTAIPKQPLYVCAVLLDADLALDDQHGWLAGTLPAAAATPPFRHVSHPHESWRESTTRVAVFVTVEQGVQGFRKLPSVRIRDFPHVSPVV